MKITTSHRANERTRFPLPLSSERINGCGGEPSTTNLSAKFVPDSLLSAATEEKDLFPQTRCARQIVPQPAGIFMDWQSEKRPACRGRTLVRRGFFFFVAVPHRACTPARLGCVLDFVRLSVIKLVEVRGRVNQIELDVRKQTQNATLEIGKPLKPHGHILIQC